MAIKRKYWLLISFVAFKPKCLINIGVITGRAAAMLCSILDFPLPCTRRPNEFNQLSSVSSRKTTRIRLHLCWEIFFIFNISPMYKCVDLIIGRNNLVFGCGDLVNQDFPYIMCMINGPRGLKNTKFLYSILLKILWVN